MSLTKQYRMGWRADEVVTLLNAQRPLRNMTLAAASAPGGILSKISQDPMNRPAGFSPRSDTMLSVVAHLMASQDLHDCMADEETRLMMVEPSQVKAVPLDTADAYRVALDTRLPFRKVYVDIAGRNGEGIPITMQNPPADVGWTERPLETFEAALWGFYLREFDEGIAAFPVVKEAKNIEHGMALQVPGRVFFYTGEGTAPLDKLTLCDVVINLRETLQRQGGGSGGTCYTMPPPVTWSSLGHQLQLANEMACYAFRFLLLLDSVNVSVAPSPLTPKQEKRIVKDNAKRPHIIRVDRTGRKARPATANKTDRKLTKRIEVMGFFRHYGKETRIFQNAPAEKQRWVPGKGECVRVWTPPHWRGPEDAPAVPAKARKVVTV